MKMFVMAMGFYLKQMDQNMKASFSRISSMGRVNFNLPQMIHKAGNLTEVGSKMGSFIATEP